MEKYFVNINGKEYEVNADILIALLDDYQENPSDHKARKAVLLDVLIPEISEEDYKTIRMSKIEEIFHKMELAQDELNSEIKKKRSRL